MGMQEEDEAPQARRTLQQFVNDPVILSFALAPQPDAAAGPRQQTATSLQGRSLLRGGSGNKLGEGLPSNVHLLTLMALEHGDVLLRLAHLYQVGFGQFPGTPTIPLLGKLFAQPDYMLRRRQILSPIRIAGSHLAHSALQHLLGFPVSSTARSKHNQMMMMM